jgi:hypothetical protein
MKKSLANFLVALIPVRRWRRAVRARLLYHLTNLEPGGKPGKIRHAYFRFLQTAKLERELTLAEKIDYISYQFFMDLGYNLDILNPKTFNEKIGWLKLFNEDPLLTICADKYRAREYVEEKIGPQALVPLIGVYDSPYEIDFSALPEKFVLRVNWGSGYNIICKDKKNLNIQKAINKLNGWMKKESNNYIHSFEFSYKNIVPKITCEHYLEQPDGQLLDYKFFCFHGQAQYIQVDFGRFTNPSRSFYDRQWELMDFTTIWKRQEEPIPKPEGFDKMIELAEKLARGFVFMRVDFYNVDGKIYFGEMTFYPDNGTGVFIPHEWDGKFGDLLTLPKNIS